MERPEDLASLTENSKQGPYSDQQVLSFTKVRSGKKNPLLSTSCRKTSLSFLNEGDSLTMAADWLPNTSS